MAVEYLVHQTGRGILQQATTDKELGATVPGDGQVDLEDEEEMLDDLTVCAAKDIDVQQVLRV